MDAMMNIVWDTMDYVPYVIIALLVRFWHFEGQMPLLKRYALIAMLSGAFLLLKQTLLFLSDQVYLLHILTWRPGDVKFFSELASVIFFAPPMYLIIKIALRLMRSVPCEKEMFCFIISCVPFVSTEIVFNVAGYIAYYPRTGYVDFLV